MQEINDWLINLKKFWVEKELQSVLSLFADNVTYFETPFLKLNSKKKILKAWQAIIDQEDIALDYSVFSVDDGKYTVFFDLSYIRNGHYRHCKGTYLLTLNSQGLCDYFCQVCECENNNAN